MSNFDNEKDYDLDYFAKKEEKEPESQDEFVDAVSDDDYSINSFSNLSDDGDDFVEQPVDDSEEIDFANFGKKRKEIKKQNSKEKKTKLKKKLKSVGKVMVSVLLIGVITGCLVVGAFAVYVFNFVDPTMDEDLDELTLAFTTTVYIKDDETGEYVEYQRLHSEENRIWVSFDKMPYNLQKAFIAVEDKRFNDHQGVDWKRTVSAFANMFLDLYSSNQGGSTITQQLVKNLTGDNKQSPMRKIREIMRARYLEDNYEKDTILECYLNTICLAGGIYGVEVASNYYFDKSVDELTLVECASLASLAKEPEKYRPDKNPKNNKTRRNTVLALMYEQGYITEEEYNEAKETELVLNINSNAKNNSKINSYFIDTLIDDVVDRMVDEYGYDESHAQKNFYNGGYKIYCTLNPDVQSVLEDEYSKTSKYFTAKSSKDGSTVQSAMTIMDYEGHIVGIVGGAGEKTENRGLNRATMSYRQPGSTMKPLAAYSQAVQKNLIHYSSMLDDEAIPNYFGGGKAGPNNWYGYYKGKVIAAYALEKSINTVPCALVKRMGVEGTYYHLTNNLGFSKLDDTEDMNLSSLGLGGTYKGITTTQSAAAFAVFGNLGKYYQPTTFTLVTDQHGNVILKEKDGHQALDENTATVMNYMLREVVYGSEGTGTLAQGYSTTMKCYAKTGTATENIDCWFAGGTPYYVGSCWFGFDQSAAVNPSSLAKQMWVNVMKRVHADLEPKEFVDSEFVTRRYYCNETGLLATDTCPNKSVGCYKTTYSLPAQCSAHAGTLLPEYIEQKPGEEGTGEGGTTPPQTDASSNSSTTTSSNAASTNSTASSTTSSTTSSATSSTTSSDSTSSAESTSSETATTN